jgi:hypothetical protein
VTRGAFLTMKAPLETVLMTIVDSKIEPKEKEPYMSTIGVNNDRKGRGDKAARRNDPSCVVANSESSDRANGRKAQCPEAKTDRINGTSLNLWSRMSESNHCVDCGFDTAPGAPTRADAEEAATAQIAAGIKNWSFRWEASSADELYFVHDHVWKASGMEPWGGCLCIGCLEKRIGRQLTPDDFPDHVFNTHLPGTPRLMERRGTPYDVLGDFPKEVQAPNLCATVSADWEAALKSAREPSTLNTVSRTMSSASHLVLAQMTAPRWRIVLTELRLEC